MGLSPEEQAVVDRFSPLMRYTMSRQSLACLLLKTPRPATWLGQSYVIKSKNLGAGVYAVTGDFDRASWEDV